PVHDRERSRPECLQLRRSVLIPLQPGNRYCDILPLINVNECGGKLEAIFSPRARMSGFSSVRTFSFPTSYVVLMSCPYTYMTLNSPSTCPVCEIILLFLALFS